MAEKRLPLKQYKEGILNGDRVVLGRAITLIESDLPKDELLASKLIDSIISYTRNSFRIGISGIPGVGKSTFLESLGNVIVEKGKKLAILAVDPSSKISGGSILGDKTRMTNLSQSPLAFIRPTPSGAIQGGIASKTYETMLLCEAAGFDYIFIETLGVGQSETNVAAITDLFLLLMITGMGDELQTMKKGIMELADLIIINKADGLNQKKAEQTAEEINQSYHSLSTKKITFDKKAITCSSTEHIGIIEVLEQVDFFKQKRIKNGLWSKKRTVNAHQTILSDLNKFLFQKIITNPSVIETIKSIENEVANGKLSSREAVNLILKNYKQIK